MFYDEKKALIDCKNDPKLIFRLIDEGYKDLTDRLLSKKEVNINTTEEQTKDDVLMYMLKKNWYDLVEKHMKNKFWLINHQNKDGDTFGHILVSKKYLDVINILKELHKNKNFIPNIRNKKGETILDKSINGKYIYTTVKVLEDERFNNIDLVSLKNLYENYVRNDNYGTYSRVNNLEVIMDNLSEKELLPKVGKIVDTISDNIKSFKEEVINNKMDALDNLIYGSLK